MKTTIVMDDITAILVWNAGKIDMTLIDTSNIPPASPEHVLQLRRTISTEQAAAIAALSVDGGETMTEDLCMKLYDIAESALKGVPLNLRPIP